MDKSLWIIFSPICTVDIYSAMSTSTLDPSFQEGNNVSQSWHGLANLLLSLLDSALQPKPKWRWQLLHTWNSSCVCDGLPPYAALQSRHLHASLWYYMPVCMYLCVCELRQTGKQLLPPFPSTLAAPVMAAPVCVSLPLPGCWRQASLMHPPSSPGPLPRPLTACVSCKAQTVFLSPVCLAEIISLGRQHSRIWMSKLVQRRGCQ